MSTSTSSTLEHTYAHLASRLGQENARLQGNAILAAPGDAAQIAELLRWAQANQVAVIPTGGGTKLDWGNPVTAGILLSLERLRRVREHAWQDMTCTVEAGCAWSAMQAELSRHGQMVALDPLWPDRATVGGVVATNDSGALRLRYGGLRDLIIGMTIVLADGTIARAGGKVVKNVAGYDLHKLMTGSFGTLGVIAEVNFRLHPCEDRPKSWTVLAGRSPGNDAMAFSEPLHALMDSQMVLSSVQLRTSEHECALDIRIAAVPECLADHEARVRNFFRAFKVCEADEAVWQARQQLFDREGAVVLKVSAPPGEICECIAEVQRCATAHEVSVTAAGQATGLITVALQPANANTAALIENLRSVVSNRGGSAMVARTPNVLRSQVDVWGPAPDALPLMREIKRRFDPQRILNPGRYVGNI